MWHIGYWTGLVKEIPVNRIGRPFGWEEAGVKTSITRIAYKGCIEGYHGVTLMIGNMPAIDL